jgi:hypothetical protein
MFSMLYLFKNRGNSYSKKHGGREQKKILKIRKNFFSYHNLSEKVHFFYCLNCVIILIKKAIMIIIQNINKYINRLKLLFEGFYKKVRIFCDYYD